MKEIPFSTVLAALADSDQAFPARYYERFSDLAPADLQALSQVWPRVSTLRKHTLLRKLVEKFEDDTLLSFDALSSHLLNDPDGQVRTLALLLLSETHDAHLLPTLVEITLSDPEPVARAQAATVLGQFIQLGELEEIPAAALHSAEEALLRVAAEQDSHLARAALESLGYSSRPEAIALISEAFERRDPHWQAAALKAAGRSADNTWQEHVLIGLTSPDQEVRLNAVVTAGELEIKTARRPLLDLLEEEDDEEIFRAIVWSLSQIGGEDIRTYLETLLDEAEDDDLAEFIEDAITNLSFTEDMESFDLLALNADDETEIKKKKRS